MLACIFPGQGSQRRGMGRELFDSSESYRELEQRIDAALGYSLRSLCLTDPDDRLKLTQYTQPCLYVVNALYSERAMREGKRPAFLAGHSLGEYNALHAAGVFDLLTGLELVKHRGALMARARAGGMAAVIGLPVVRLEDVLGQAGFAGIDIANYNSPSQTVLSGPQEELERARPLLQEAGAKMVVPLNVSAAFHSRHMRSAAAEFAGFVQSLQFSPPNVPVVANATGRLYPGNDAAGIAELLVRQIHSPVRWTESIRYMSARGVTEFAELGPGNVLTKLVDQINASEIESAVA